MEAVKPQPFSNFGHQLVDSIAIPEPKLNILFAALLLTAIGVFLGGNVLLLEASVLLESGQIALPCLAMLLIFYALSRASGSVTWGLALTYGLMWGVTYSRQAWLIPVVYGLGFFALAYAVRFLRVNRQQWGLVLLMAVIATATVLGCERAMTSFDMVNRLHSGYVVPDTLFHASIAAMIKNYGVVSTGLHGLVETPYHVLSHTLIASLSAMSGFGVIEVYGVAPWVLFAPLLIFGVAACVVMLDRAGQLDVTLVWGMICVLLVVCPFLLNHWRLTDLFFISESYLVSLGLMLPGLPLLFKRQLSASDLLLVVALTALISNAKGPVGLIFAGLWLTRILFVRGDRILIELVAVFLSVIAAGWVVFDLATASSESIYVSPLHFISTGSLLGGYIGETGKVLLHGGSLSWHSVLLAITAFLSFYAFHFLLSWVVIAQAAYRKGALSLLKAPVAVYSSAAVFAGSLIIFLFATGYDNTFYFSGIAFFVALPGVVAVSANWIGERQWSTPLVLGLGILLVCLLGVNGFYSASALFPARSAQLPSPFIDTLLELRQSTPTDVVMQPGVALFASNDRWNTVYRLSARGTSPPMVICSNQPFVFPAVSERPWINIIVPRNDCTYHMYGYSHYGINTLQQRVTVEPRLLPGMEILRWPRPASDPKSINGELDK